MSESIVVGIVLVPFVYLIGLEVYFWLWRTKESTCAPMTAILAIPIATNEVGWPLWFRWTFPVTVFVVLMGCSILIQSKGWRGIFAKGRDRRGQG